MSNRQTSSLLLARRYANALFDLAKEKNAVDAVSADLATLSKAAETPSFDNLLNNPLISSEKQRKALEGLAASMKLSDTTQKFIAVLTKNRRLPLLLGAAEAFEALSRAHRGESAVQVTSATALKPEQKTAIQKSLESKLKTKVTLTEKVDASLIGGIVVKVGSRLLDMSIKGKLQRLASSQKRAA